tara:strand:+ start:188 stop:445 length:258 start_codon:yes stop_codon:yes gene_type:complete
MAKIFKLNTFKNIASLRGETTSLADYPCIEACSWHNTMDKGRCSVCGLYDYQHSLAFWNSLPRVERKMINLNNSEKGYKIKQIYK